MRISSKKVENDTLKKQYVQKRFGKIYLESMNSLIDPKYNSYRIRITKKIQSKKIYDYSYNYMVLYSYIIPLDIMYKIKKMIITIFDNNFISKNLNGKKYFQGDLESMIAIIKDCCLNINQ